MRILVSVALVVVVAGACTSDEPAPVGESTTSTVTTATSASVPATTTTAPAPSTTTTMWVPEPYTLEPVAATPYEAEPLVWRNTGVTFERRPPEQYWVGSMGDRFVFVEFDWPAGGLTVSTSVDGVDWERASLPETLGPEEVPLSEWAVVRVAASAAGVVVVLNRNPIGREQLEPSHLLISTDGWTFAESDLSALQGIPVPSNPASIAAGAAGFAIITEDPTSRADPVNWLYVSDDGVEWHLVDIPDAHRDLGWVEGLGNGWIAQGPYRRGPDNEYPVYVISAGGDVELRTAPWDFVPQSWGDHGLMHVYTERLVDDHLDEAPSFYATDEALAWWRLPFPDQGPFNEQDYDAWYVETIAGDGPDDQLLILGCGDGCVGMWEFYGDSFFPVAVETNGWTVEIFGDYVSYSNGSRWESIRDASDLYDSATETLTIVEDGETIASVSCDEMRQAAADLEWPSERGGLTEFPDEALWHSYNGTSWHAQAVDALFGTESYVFAADVTDERVLAVVTPNGDRYVEDPLGCELGLFPEEQPLEVWVADLPTSPADGFDAATASTTDWGYIYALPDGLSCQALFDGGYSYEEAFVYWLGENDSGYMIDYEVGEEVICQSIYPAAEVSRFWDDSGPVTADQFAIITSIDLESRTIVADYATFLWGDELLRACIDEGSTEELCLEGPAFEIRNVNPRLRTLPVAPDAAIAAFAWIGDAPYSCAIAMPWQMNDAGLGLDRSAWPVCFYSLEDFHDLWNNDLVWLAVEGGVVTGIQTQYTP